MNRKTTRNRISGMVIRMQTRLAWVVGATDGGSGAASAPPVEESGAGVDGESGAAALGPSALLSMALALLAGLAAGRASDVSWESAAAAVLLCLGGIALLTVAGPEKEEDEKGELQRQP